MVIDIGMNLGWFTALAAANGLQVVAFEPSPARIQYMAKTLELNGWTSVQLRQGALANEVGQLFVDEARWWEKRSASREGGHGKTQAEALRLDDVVPANTKVCLLKADCHGCEAEAFRSGKQLLEGGAVQVVQMEYDHSVASRASLEILQGMSPHPWQCILLPMGISCSGSDLADKDGDAFQELWDFVAGARGLQRQHIGGAITFKRQRVSHGRLAGSRRYDGQIARSAKLCRCAATPSRRPRPTM